MKRSIVVVYFRETEIGNFDYRRLKREYEDILNGLRTLV